MGEEAGATGQYRNPVWLSGDFHRFGDERSVRDPGEDRAIAYRVQTFDRARLRNPVEKAYIDSSVLSG
jgi:hypothetical protein